MWLFYISKYVAFRPNWNKSVCHELTKLYCKTLWRKMLSRTSLAFRVSKENTKLDSKQDKVNTADSAFIFLIILLTSQLNTMVSWVRAEKMILSRLVFARKIARMILIQNVEGLMGPLMINMAFMPLYMWEMWVVTPVTHGHTDTRTVGK